MGVISGCDASTNQINGPGSCFYDADLRDVEEPFRDAYVEVVARREGSGAVPYLPPSFFAGFQFAPGGSCSNIVTQPVPGYDFGPMYRFGWLWFANHGANNYIWLCGAGQTAPLDGCTVGCSGQYPMPQYLGLSAANSQESFVFAGHHELYCSYTPNGVRENTNHELGHDFFVNPTASSQGHDNRCQWTADEAASCSTPPAACADPNTACLMNPLREIWTNQHRFDRYELLCGDSGCPNGQPGCCSACALPGNGSIRRLNDPVQGVAP
ncbi:MAG: hypothetical protein ACOYZ8_19560 [Chloroflexota bacterium]